MAERSTIDVVNEHLALRREGRTEEDLEANYHEDVVVLSHLGQFRGLDGMRTLAQLLDEQLVGARFYYDTVLFDGDHALVLWTAEAQDLHVSHSADSFFVRDGRIAAQTIYYALSTVPDRRAI